MTDTINRGRALADRLDYAMPLDVNPADVAHAIRALVTELEAARADLAVAAAQMAAAARHRDEDQACIAAEVKRRQLAEAELAAARAALTEIARPKRGGVEICDSDADHAAYWQSATELERRTARDALARIGAAHAAEPQPDAGGVCPFCLGDGRRESGEMHEDGYELNEPCPVCNGTGRAKGGGS